MDDQMQSTSIPKQISKHPPFSIRDIRKIIPSDLFERSYLKSAYWLLHDCILILTSLYIATFIQYVPFTVLRGIFWCIWWYIIGILGAGLWVIAHECGHNAFSPNKLLNNIIGYIFHTMFLVPYFSWQYTHGIHHSKTNHMQLDTVHVPRIKHAKHPRSIHSRLYCANPKCIKSHSLGIYARLKLILTNSLLGWPAHLLMDVTGAPQYDEISYVSHFYPFSAAWPPSMIPWVLFTDIGLVLWVFVLYKIYTVIGAMNIIFYYFIPYFVINHWLVTVTFLQHTDWNIDRYNDNEWTWLRGAFGSIDRNYGWFFNNYTHHIADSHVIHHLFSKMPHYNAIKATEYLRNDETFSKYYLYSDETWYGALWRIVGDGQWIQKNKDILQLKKIQSD